MDVGCCVVAANVVAVGFFVSVADIVVVVGCECVDGVVDAAFAPDAFAWDFVDAVECCVVGCGCVVGVSFEFVCIGAVDVVGCLTA